MFAVTGITGKVGGEVARTLLAGGKSVRAVVRDAAKGEVWAARGCEVATAEITDVDAIAEAFKGAEAVFVLMPPNFDPRPGFPEVHALAGTLKAALLRAKPGRVVLLSTIGAQASRTNLLTQLGHVERELSFLPCPVAFLRPAWFLENIAGDLASVRKDHSFQSFLQPLSRAFPMVATADVGAVAAELLQDVWTGLRVVELEGRHRVSPSDMATLLSQLLGSTITIETPPRAEWEAIFRKQGMKNPEPRMRMLDGFNEGWISFEGEQTTIRKGRVAADQVLKSLLLGDSQQELVASS